VSKIIIAVYVNDVFLNISFLDSNFVSRSPLIEHAKKKTLLSYNSILSYQFNPISGTRNSPIRTTRTLDGETFAECAEHSGIY